MKKLLFLFFAIFSFGFAFSEIPDELKGIWTANDRIIFFGGNDEISIILKEYYGWYYDRAEEPERFKNIQERTRNIATQKTGYDYKVNFVQIAENVSAWEMEIKIDEKTKSIIPIALINNKIYVNFLIKIPYDKTDTTNETENLENTESNESGIFGYWQVLNCADSIRICPRKNKENINSWYITENGAYSLRFWLTDMPNESTKAVFSDAGILYTINKHIFSAGANYTCVSGRGTNIRNVEKYNDFPYEYVINENGTILALGTQYLSKVEEKSSAEELMEIVKEANSRRKPNPPDLFEKQDLDWHWDLINELEKDNEIIQEVRKRQKEFGARTADSDNNNN